MMKSQSTDLIFPTEGYIEASSIMLTLEIRGAEICLTQLRLKVKKEYFLT